VRRPKPGEHDDPIKQWCERLATHLHSRPNATSRRQVEDGLRSKWEGVQVWAGWVLASWGDRQSIDLLRGWLEHMLTKEAEWTVRCEAVRALCQCYRPADVPWMLDLYFGSTDPLLRHEFGPFIFTLPEDAIRRRIRTESQSASETRRGEDCDPNPSAPSDATRSQLQTPVNLPPLSTESFAQVVQINSGA
jgi:hypothetical protein